MYDARAVPTINACMSVINVLMVMTHQYRCGTTHVLCCVKLVFCIVARDHAGEVRDSADSSKCTDFTVPCAAVP